MGLLQATFVVTYPELRAYIFLAKLTWIIRNQSCVDKGCRTSRFTVFVHIKQTKIRRLIMNLHEFHNTLRRISKTLLALHDALQVRFLLLKGFR